MFQNPLRRVSLGLLVWGVTLSAGAADTEFNPVAREPRDAAETVGVIFKLRADGAGTAVAKLADASERAAAVGKRNGLDMRLRREISATLLAGTVSPRPRPTIRCSRASGTCRAPRCPR
jgi:hypothetical protein